MQQLNEAPRNNKSLEEMSKTELRALAEQFGIKLDNNLQRGQMIAEVEEILILNKMNS
jgi:hypothetical protein